ERRTAEGTISFGRRRLATLFASMLLSLGLLAVAAPSSFAAFGQLESWGSFGFGNAQFADPVMIGVDTSDGSVFAGDMTKENATNDREFLRIQKLSATGTFLAKVEIPRYADLPATEIQRQFWGIAVDPGLQRFYVLEGAKEGETGGEIYAKQVRVYSTVPKEGKLVAPESGPATLPLPSPGLECTGAEAICI